MVLINKQNGLFLNEETSLIKDPCKSMLTCYFFEFNSFL